MEKALLKEQFSAEQLKSRQHQERAAAADSKWDGLQTQLVAANDKAAKTKSQAQVTTTLALSDQWAKSQGLQSLCLT